MTRERGRKPILFVDHAPALGGAERFLLLLADHLDRDHWQPHLVCSGGPLADAAARRGVAVHRVPMPRLRRSPRAPLDWARTAGAIARLGRRVGARAMVANTMRAAVYTVAAARLARFPFLWYMHDFWLGESRPRRLWLDRWGKRVLCAAAARVIANSYATAAHLPCAGKVTVVHNGIDVAAYSPTLDGGLFRQAYDIPADVPVVGTVGRLRPWKGQDRFLAAMARVAERHPDARFLVVGGTPFNVQDDYPARLRRLAVDLGIAARVVFTGHLDDVRPALAAMDVFVHAGDPEPFGLVVVEAMAMAKPVVAFAHGALPEIVSQETGILAPPGDVEALAAGVARLLDTKDLARMMGRRGRARVEQHFTIERTARAFEEVLMAMDDGRWTMDDSKRLSDG